MPITATFSMSLFLNSSTVLQTTSNAPLANATQAKTNQAITHPQAPRQVIKIEAIAITPETFAPYGQLIEPQAEVPFSSQDAQLQLANGQPRFYIMALHQRGRRFHTITRHGRCTQCLGALEGKTWFLGVAPPNDAPNPRVEDIQVFKIPGNCFVKLDVGTWHAGPYFDDDTVNFYNLELSDTNIVDHTTCDLAKTYGTEFEIV